MKFPMALNQKKKIDIKKRIKTKFIAQQKLGGTK